MGHGAQEVSSNWYMRVVWKVVCVDSAYCITVLKQRGLNWVE